jgi:hypothetical protein
MRNTTSQPTDCKVSFIESDGASWINTEVNPNKFIVADFKFSLRQFSYDTKVIFGTYYDRATHPQIQVVLQSGTYIEPQHWCDITGINFYETLVLNKQYHLTVTTKQTSTTSAPFYIMARNNDINNFLSPRYMRLYSLNIKERDSGTVLRNMYPYVDGKGIPCMRDSISLKNFYNAGTGSFIAGSPVE